MVMATARRAVGRILRFTVLLCARPCALVFASDCRSVFDVSSVVNCRQAPGRFDPWPCMPGSMPGPTTGLSQAWPGYDEPGFASPQAAIEGSPGAVCLRGDAGAQLGHHPRCLGAFSAGPDEIGRAHV